MKPLELAERTIVIIGGTSGLGFSAAKACVRAGANVVLVGRKADVAQQAQEELGKAAKIFVGDATNSSTAKEAITLALDTFGRFDSLYHVAGGSGRRQGDGPLHEVTDNGVEQTLQLNLSSLIYSNRAAVCSFLERKTSGTILNMTSVLGASPSPHFFATHVYAAAKSAVPGYTKSCASYYAKHNIRFNAIAPALVDTNMSRRASDDKVIQQFIKTKQPLEGGRIGKPEDLDAAVVFLLSDASKYVTGQVMAVDGGWSVSEGQIPSE